MAFDAFLKIDGIPGESTDDRHKDEIEVLSYSFGASQPISGVRSTAGAGSSERANFQELVITKQTDKASPKLFLFCASGNHIKEVTLVLHRATGSKQKYLEVKMTQVIISSYTNGGAKDTDFPRDSVSMNFGKIDIVYTATDHATGASKGDVKSNWDLITNKGG